MGALMTADRGGFETLDGLMMLRRLQSVARNAPMAVVATLASLIALLIAFRNSDYLPFIASWALLAGALSLWGSMRLARMRQRITPAKLPLHLHAAAVFLGAGSIIWAAGLLGLALIARGTEVAMVAIIGTSLFVGVLLVHRALPAVAHVHIASMSLAIGAASWAAFGPAGWPVLLLIAAYAATLVLTVRRIDRGLIESVRQEVERGEVSQSVRLLLEDYEEQSSDWLWRVDAEGRLHNIGGRFAGASGRDASTLEGLPFTDLFESGEARDRLAASLAQRAPFTDLVVHLTIDGETRHWRLSGRAHQDGGMRGVARDITVDRQNETRAARMAHYDHLTGLANRYLFNERLRHATGADGGPPGSVALFYIDLDDFKSVNDTRGHLVGDRLLREVADRLQAQVRSDDLVARLGGDEFAVLMETRAGESLLIERGHRFLSVVRQPFEIDGQSYRISTSVGVARCVNGDCDAEELMRRADLALYAAKSKGRDNFALFEPQLDRAARARREMEIDLADALANGEFRLHYQPIIDLGSGRVTALEALLRWHHPRRGLVSPANFLPVAEKTGLIVPIGEWVIRQALHEMSTRGSDLRLAVNLSPTQVKDPGLVAVIAQALYASDISPAQVEFEITEHVVMEAGEQNLTTLEKLHELGVSIALDDFGTGYSSLSYLRRFPFDRIKIDRHFVENVVQDADSRAIVASVAQLAQALGMQTTAEGVERLDQLEALRSLGVEEAQGFFIGKPEPGERIDLSLIEQAGRRSAADESVLDYRQARAQALRRRSNGGNG